MKVTYTILPIASTSLEILYQIEGKETRYMRIPGDSKSELTVAQHVENQAKHDLEFNQTVLERNDLIKTEVLELD